VPIVVEASPVHHAVQLEPVKVNRAALEYRKEEARNTPDTDIASNGIPGNSEPTIE